MAARGGVWSKKMMSAGLGLDLVLFILTKYRNALANISKLNF